MVFAAASTLDMSSLGQSLVDKLGSMDMPALVRDTVILCNQFLCEVRILYILQGIQMHVNMTWNVLNDKSSLNSLIALNQLIKESPVDKLSLPSGSTIDPVTTMALLSVIAWQMDVLPVFEM